MCGNSVMYNTGKIITFGGAPDYQASTATTNSVLLTLTGTTVAIKTVGPLNRARSFATGVALPDGKVLAIGGQANPQPFDDNTAAFETGALPASEDGQASTCTVPRVAVDDHSHASCHFCSFYFFLYSLPLGSMYAFLTPRRDAATFSQKVRERICA
jgi:hypothetical protein